MTSITSAKAFFNEVLKFNLSSYKENPSSLPAAYNLANALFSMHEWMWHTYGDALGKNLYCKNDFNNYVQTACPNFKHMRDLANAAKHVSLNNPSTQATHISNTTAIENGYGEGAYGSSKYGRSAVVINDGSTKVDFECAANDVFIFWQQQIERLEA